MSCEAKEKACLYADINNIWHRYSKINYAKLLEHIKKQYNVIRSNAFSCIDIREEKQKKFITYLSTNGWCCETVDQTVNTDVDSMVITNMCNDSNILDHSIICLIGGDKDYAYPLLALKKCGYKIHIIGCKDNVSLELIKLADNIEYLENIKDIILED